MSRIKPAEWHTHRATWLAWPSHPQLWQQLLEQARSEFVELCRTIVVGAEHTSERLEVLVLDDAGEREAAERLASLPVRFHRLAFGDVWLRDTGPLFTFDSDGRRLAVVLGFNGWGGKYCYPHDAEVASAISARTGWTKASADIVAEGGGLEFDGEGTCITTRSCLLDSRRNPGLSERGAQAVLAQAFGVSRVVWLERGLRGDHTDGHVDNIARFCRPGVVLCMQAHDRNDPNAEVLEEVATQLVASSDAQDRAIEVVRVPSPGLVSDARGEPLPASYLNFYISNTSVVVPVFGSAYDREAVEVIAGCFGGRRTVGLPARALLAEGGTFHCITQQEPARLVAEHARET